MFDAVISPSEETERILNTKINFALLMINLNSDLKQHCALNAKEHEKILEEALKLEAIFPNSSNTLLFNSSIKAFLIAEREKILNTSFESGLLQNQKDLTLTMMAKLIGNVEIPNQIVPQAPEYEDNTENTIESPLGADVNEDVLSPNENLQNSESNNIQASDCVKTEIFEEAGNENKNPSESLNTINEQPVVDLNDETIPTIPFLQHNEAPQFYHQVLVPCYCNFLVGVCSENGCPLHSSYPKIFFNTSQVSPVDLYQIHQHVDISVEDQLPPIFWTAHYYPMYNVWKWFLARKAGV